MRIRELRLEAPADSLDAIEAFYADLLGFARLGAGVSVAAGPSRISWVVTEGERRPFYHFALLVPGHRFEAAHAWLAERVELLSHHGERTIAFADWDAFALYFHDPAGSIVELIAHREIEGEGPRRGTFTPAELLGVSEVGIVVEDKRAAAAALEARVGIALWAGTVGTAEGLAFVGRKAHTLILTAPERGWMPTGRPAEAHPVSVVVAGTGAAGGVALGGGAEVRAAQ